MTPSLSSRAPRRDPGIVLAMGTFDGVHRGHRALLARAVSRARQSGLPCAAMTFRRPPRLFFSPSRRPSLLSLPEEKKRLLESQGAHRVIELSFGSRLAGVAPRDFFIRRLIKNWNARTLVVGYNFRFGRDRSGTPALLAQWGKEHGVQVVVVPPVTVGGIPVSSGRIRRLLEEGEVGKANRLLGAPYGASGPVVTGEALGRRLGFPTANVAVPKEKILPPGVHAVHALLPDGRLLRGMANVGTRPTLNRRLRRRTLEVHLFDFKRSIVGQSLQVLFLKKIRDERRFPSLEALQRQLSRDAASARAALSS